MGMNRIQANLCLICVTLIWSTEIIIFACIPAGVPPFATTCITNLTGVALMFLCFSRRIIASFRKDGSKLLLRCLLLGVLDCAYNVLYIYGLKFFDVSSGAFILSMDVVILPLILLICRDHVDHKTWISAGLVLAGILIATAQSLFSVRFPGLLLLFGGSVFRSIFIIRLNEYARKYDPVSIAAGYSLFVAVISFVIWVIIQPSTFAAIPWRPEVIASLFVYSYFVIAFAEILNIFAQRRATPASATIIYSSEIIFSLLWGFILPDSLIRPVVPNVFIFIGAAFVVLGNLVEMIDFSRFKRKKAARGDTS